MAEPARETFKAHPIRLTSVVARSIQFDVKYVAKSVEPEARDTLLPTTFNFTWGIGEMLEGHVVEVGLGVDVAFAEDQLRDGTPPYELKVEVVGVAVWDPDAIPDDVVKAWGQRGSPYALFPYLRELVSDLTARSGFPTVTLPLMVLPTPIGKSGEDSRKEQPAPDGSEDKP